MSASYFLSPHVHVCVAGKQVILLDLERDKYLAVAHPHPVGRWVRGWPLPQAAPATPVAAVRDLPPPAAPGPENSLLARMISQGLLVTDSTLGKEAAPVVADQPKVALVEYDVRARPRAGLKHLWNFFHAYSTAQWSLQHRPIKAVVQAARQRKRRAQGVPGPDIATIRGLVTAFVH